MLFNSFEFLVFLPVVFILYWFVFKGRKPQNLLIVLTSYIFYGWWDWRFLILIAFTSLCSFFSGKLIGKNGQNPKKQHFISAANIIINLSVLGVFKYYNFFAESCADLLKLFGFEADFVTLNVILPVGISFIRFRHSVIRLTFTRAKSNQLMTSLSFSRTFRFSRNSLQALSKEQQTFCRNFRKTEILNIQKRLTVAVRCFGDFSRKW